jgi:hypothetical protein
MKKNFIAPFIYMLIIGLLSAGSSIYNIHNLTHGYFSRFHINPLYKVFLFFWPAVALIEAFLYWNIRQRNRSRVASWLHCILYTLAFLAPYSRRLLVMVMGNFYSLAQTAQLMDAARRGELVCFWIFMVLAHIFFIWVLIKSMSPREEIILDLE